VLAELVELHQQKIQDPLEIIQFLQAQHQRVVATVLQMLLVEMVDQVVAVVVV
jgi:hypothetical protein